MALLKELNLQRNKHQLSKLQRTFYGTQQKWKRIEASSKALQTINPTRKIWDSLSDYKISSHKEFISIAIGDPTKYIDPPHSIRQALSNAYNAPNTTINSYCNSNGLESARIAISKQYTHCTPQNVVITGGCQQAIDVIIYSLLNNPKDHILLPTPCWPEYVTNLNKYGFGYKYYQLLPDKQWQIDADNLESLIDDHTRAILTNNPSNPCGSILNYDTIYNVLQIADKYKIPIISDEIYSNIIFPNENTEERNEFISYATVKQKESVSVPVIIASGLAKNYLVPGWKVGWIVFDDNDDGSLEMIKQAITQLMQVNFGPSSLCQSMIADVIQNTDNEFWNDLSKRLYEQSELFCNLINDNIPELEGIAGRGAFYMMVKIHLDKFKDIESDYDFFEKLLKEQAVFVLPGAIFKMDGYFRAVICAPTDVLTEVVHRLEVFCEQHRL